MPTAAQKTLQNGNWRRERFWCRSRPASERVCKSCFCFLDFSVNFCLPEGRRGEGGCKREQKDGACAYSRFTTFAKVAREKSFYVRGRNYSFAMLGMGKVKMSCPRRKQTHWDGAGRKEALKKRLAKRMQDKIELSDILCRVNCIL